MSLIKPVNCPLSDEQWARLHPDLKSSPSWIWMPIDAPLPVEIANAMLAVCNRQALVGIAHLLLTGPNYSPVEMSA